MVKKNLNIISKRSPKILAAEIIEKWRLLMWKIAHRYSITTKISPEDLFQFYSLLVCRFCNEYFLCKKSKLENFLKKVMTNQSNSLYYKYKEENTVLDINGVEQIAKFSIDDMEIEIPYYEFKNIYSRLWFDEIYQSLTGIEKRIMDVHLQYGYLPIKEIIRLIPSKMAGKTHISKDCYYKYKCQLKKKFAEFLSA